MKTFKRLLAGRSLLAVAKLRRERAATARKLRAAQQRQREALGQRALIAVRSAFPGSRYRR